MCQIWANTANNTISAISEHSAKSISAGVVGLGPWGWAGGALWPGLWAWPMGRACGPGQWAGPVGPAIFQKRVLEKIGNSANSTLNKHFDSCDRLP